MQLGNVIARTLTRGLVSSAQYGRNRRVRFRLYLGAGLFVTGVLVTITGLLFGKV